MSKIKICAPSRIYGSYKGGRFSASAMIEYMSKIGFDGVDISLESLDRLDDSWKSIYYSAKRLADTKGLEIPSCHLPYYMPNPLDKIQMEGFSKQIKKGIDIAAHICIPLAVVHPIALHAKTFSVEEWARANLEFLSPICQYAKDCGVRLLIENMASSCEGDGDHLYGSTAAEIAALADALGVGCCWDFGHAHLSGRDESEVGLLCDRLSLVHIHDNNGYTDSHSLPFEGSVNWEKAMRSLKDMGYSGYLNIEMSAWTLSPDEYVREQFGRRILYLGQRLASMTE